MNILDRAIGAFSPERALRRAKARKQLDFMASYHGADLSRRALKNWRPGSGSADSDTLSDTGKLRDHARDLVRNAPLATGALNTMATSVVGAGISCQPAIDRDFLGLTEAEADAWERDALRIFEAWSESCDITGQLDFKSMQELTFRSWMESGDNFAIRRFKERKGDLLGLKIQLIESDLVCNKDSAMDSAILRGGVHKDLSGRPISYDILTGHPNDDRLGFGMGANEWTNVRAFSATGEKQVLHLYHKLRVGQTRGVSIFAPVIELLKQLEDYSEAEITAAVLAAYFTVFVRTTGEDDSTGLMAIDAADTDPPPETELKLGKGLITDLRPGEDIVTANPSRPNDSFDPFVQAILRQIGVALEIPFEILIKHFTASYSASRAALLEAWRAFLTRRRRLSRQFCQPCYKWVITEAVARGLIGAPGFLSDPLTQAAWLGAEWTGPSAGQIDPLREINAAEKRVALGVSTLQETTAEMTGGDWERKHAQRTKEERMRREAGLVGATMDGIEIDPTKEPGEDEIPRGARSA